MLEVHFIQDSAVENLFYDASSGSEPSMLLHNYLFGLRFKPFQDEFQHDFAQVTDMAENSVALAELPVDLFKELIISDNVHRVGHTAVLQILL